MNKKVISRNFVCKYCEKEFPLIRGKNGNFNEREVCDRCLEGTIGKKTKREIFSSRKNYQSARTEFRRFASKEIKKHKIKKVCFVCGYDKHVMICHKKPVYSFSENSLLEEISNVENLVYLCPNHHWELDNGLLEI
jgi:hypothetical protein